MSKQEPAAARETATGRIVKAIAGFYYAQVGGTVYQCKARGIFRKQKTEPLVGDLVEISLPKDDKTDGTVEAILPRKNSLIRPPLANVDRLFIVSAFSNPAPSALLIDKLTAICEHKGIEPILIFNKSDQGDFAKWERLYRHAGFTVYVVSCATGDGVDAVRDSLGDGISVFSGNSGVGKSSLLNRLFDRLDLATGEVSEKLGRGRHTTRTVELFATEYGGYVADTPGFASLDLEKTEMVSKDDLPYAFRDFAPYAGHCKFTSCAHIGEKGCAVCAAVDAGEIEPSRHENYRKLYDEVKDIKPWMLQK